MSLSVSMAVRIHSWRATKQVWATPSIEDAVTVTTVALLDNPRFKAKLLIAIGVGCDRRFNGISDGASLRAMAKWRAQGGFLGSMAMECGNTGLKFYSDFIEYLQRAFSFRSVISNSIIESRLGAYGSDVVPAAPQHRIACGELFLWPLVSELFAFDPVIVAKRNVYSDALANCRTVNECYRLLDKMRFQLKKDGKIRPSEILAQ